MALIEMATKAEETPDILTRLANLEEGQRNHRRHIRSLIDRIEMLERRVGSGSPSSPDEDIL